MKMYGDEKTPGIQMMILIAETCANVNVSVFRHQSGQMFLPIRLSSEDLVFFFLYLYIFIDRYIDTIYQQLRSGRMWHKVNF